jgi:hypothetical protein
LNEQAFVKAVTEGGFMPVNAHGLGVVYQANDPEAYGFALSIQRTLLNMHWRTIHDARALPPDFGSDNPSTFGLPALVGQGGGQVSLFVRPRDLTLPKKSKP